MDNLGENLPDYQFIGRKRVKIHNTERCLLIKYDN